MRAYVEPGYRIGVQAMTKRQYDFTLEPIDSPEPGWLFFNVVDAWDGMCGSCIAVRESDRKHTRGFSCEVELLSHVRRRPDAVTEPEWNPKYPPLPLHAISPRPEGYAYRLEVAVRVRFESTGEEWLSCHVISNKTGKGCGYVCVRLADKTITTHIYREPLEPFASRYYGLGEWPEDIEPLQIP